MADVKVSGFDSLVGLDRQWVRRSLEVLRMQLVRSRMKEVPGSEIYVLRGKELAQLDVLIGKL